MSTNASTTSMDQSEEGLNREDEQEMERRSHRLKLPEDGYKWKKYGQKFIKNIGKFRENCMAKKRAEWSSRSSDGELGEIRIMYEVMHSHDQLSSSASNSQGTFTSSSNANQYNLLTQVLGGDHQSTSTPRPPHS
ncbi:hypothetical protein Q3G72_032035 [Acer saccharum]|nr:hypothetical protein Q3G72_032035 [Acer saccharum]